MTDRSEVLRKAASLLCGEHPDLAQKLTELEASPDINRQLLEAWQAGFTEGSRAR